MDIADVMDQISARLDSTIADLRCYPFPPDAALPPFALVGYPDLLTFDETYGRGMDRIALPVIVLVAKVSDRAARNQMTAYWRGSGPRSIKSVLESGAYTAFHTLRVMSAETNTETFAAVDYLAAIFNLDIAGAGA